MKRIASLAAATIMLVALSAFGGQATAPTEAVVASQDTGVASPPIAHAPTKVGNVVVFQTSYHLVHPWELRLQRHRFWGWQTVASSSGTHFDPSISWFCGGQGTYTYRGRLIYDGQTVTSPQSTISC
jgi:hypothetical protein